MKLKNENWIKKSEETAYRGYRTIVKRHFTMPDGNEVTFDIVQGSNIVCTFALTPEKKVVLVRQFRPGPERMFYDLPAGHMEANESPHDAAARELLEETGYAGKLELVGEGFASAYTTSYRYHFVATNCVKVAEPQLDATEFMEVSEMYLEEVVNKLPQGFLSDFSDAATCYFALKYLQLLSIADPKSGKSAAPTTPAESPKTF